MTIKELIDTEKTKKAFSKKYNIPYRTVQCWYDGTRKPPEYVVDLLIKVYNLQQQENNEDLELKNGEYIHG